jgi:hypothetical protein
MATPNNSKRDGLLQEIEKRLETKVIAYLTGDRPNLVAQVSSDVIPKFRRHLETIGDVDSISLFLYTRGGDTNVPWRLVNLIREYCTKFNVLVPFRAHSAGTLICLGADEILSGRMAELTSIDPSVANPFNPPDPTNPAARIPISVEDVNAFKELARRFGVGGDKGDKISEKEADHNTQVFLSLASRMEPLALGNVERAHSQIKKLAADLLSLHPPQLGEEKTKELVRMLTVGLYSHQHIISRKEAKALGLNVKIIDKETDAHLWKLFDDYSEEMELEKPFNPAQMVAGSNPALRVTATRAVVESIGKTDAFVSEGSISRVQPGAFQFPPGVQVPPQLAQQLQLAVQFNFEGWKVVR